MTVVVARACHLLLRFNVLCLVAALKIVVEKAPRGMKEKGTVYEGAAVSLDHTRLITNGDVSNAFVARMLVAVNWKERCTHPSVNVAWIMDRNVKIGFRITCFY